MDVSPSSLSSKRIKTSDAVPNGRSARKVRNKNIIQNYFYLIYLGST